MLWHLKVIEVHCLLTWSVFLRAAFIKLRLKEWFRNDTIAYVFIEKKLKITRDSKRNAIRKKILELQQSEPLLPCIRNGKYIGTILPYECSIYEIIEHSVFKYTFLFKDICTYVTNSLKSFQIGIVYEYLKYEGDSQLSANQRLSWLTCG